jgi:uncharacterized protein YybS (DUF2232 family)
VASQTRALTETAFLAALTAVLFFVAQIPLIGPFLCVSCPFPVTLMFYRHGFRRGLIGVAASLLLIALVQGALALLALPFLFLGALVGVLLRRRVGPLACLVAGGFGLGLLLFSVAWPYENIYAARWGMKNFRDLAGETSQKLLGGAEAYRMASLKMEPETYRQTQEGTFLKTAGTVVHQFLLAISWMPLAVLFFLGAFASWIYYLAAAPILRRFDVEMVPLPPLQDWTLGRISGLLLVPVLVPEVFPQLGVPDGGIPYLRLFLLNLELLCKLSLVLLGVARLDLFMADRLVPWPLRRVVEVFLLALPLPGFLSGFRILILGGIVAPWWVNDVQEEKKLA